MPARNELFHFEPFIEEKYREIWAQEDALLREKGREYLKYSFTFWSFLRTTKTILRASL